MTRINRALLAAALLAAGEAASAAIIIHAVDRQLSAETPLGGLQSLSDSDVTLGFLDPQLFVSSHDPVEQQFFPLTASANNQAYQLGTELVGFAAARTDRLAEGQDNGTALAESFFDITFELTEAAYGFELDNGVTQIAFPTSSGGAAAATWGLFHLGGGAIVGHTLDADDPTDNAISFGVVDNGVLDPGMYRFYGRTAVQEDGGGTGRTEAVSLLGPVHLNLTAQDGDIGPGPGPGPGVPEPATVLLLGIGLAALRARLLR